MDMHVQRDALRVFAGEKAIHGNQALAQPQARFAVQRGPNLILERMLASFSGSVIDTPGRTLRATNRIVSVHVAARWLRA